ncbi:LysR substrate binding domain protein (plasmid) [Sodalis praecaptivus]|uniref:LysR substrate binding domain protein n=1 Tax=Sodalis praecaptivus TaxID=1239307 RepID=W0I423_9GAMM|nr:LysR family transcriptional regulator [Sodalis praecaptivus]AHF79220.1 LysR substrate binding domain protein [Sodalis praecaptivus]
MDRITRMQLFVRIVESHSFVKAAQEMGIGRSTATSTIQRLEKELSVRLLTRTTRHVTTTPEGKAFYQRIRTILAELDEACGAFKEHDPKGHLRIEAPGLLTRTFIVPHLPAFMMKYPGLTLQFGQTDRLVDLVRDGIDCAIRAGELNDSGLFYRRLGALQEVTCASPAYFQKYGLPASIDDLKGHYMVGFVSSRTGQIMPLEFMHKGKREIRTIPALVTADNSDTVADLARMGFGLIQAPRYRFEKELAHGELIEVFADKLPQPMPLNVVYPHKNQMSRRLSVFLDWLQEIGFSAQVALSRQ